MARKRTPCEWCGGEFEGTWKDHRNGYCLWLEVYPYHHLIAAIAQANDENGDMIEDSVEIPMNYCPNCGRKIEEIS